MYYEGGYAYVYLIYGMYYCFNVVTSEVDKPEAILIRALEPIEGIELMKKRTNKKKITELCNGPGKLCNALGIDKSDNGLDLCGDELYITQGEKIDEKYIKATPRINIDYSGPAKDYLWRFVISDSPYLSRKK
jgi:DNA-3-methyladenine glycosylase